jgi:hypothetical protein
VTHYAFFKIPPLVRVVPYNSYLVQRRRVGSIVADPHPDPDPYVFGPPGSVSYKYGSGSRSFNHQAKIVRKPALISTVF